MKVPKNEIVVTLGPSETSVAASLDLEKNAAVNQKAEKLNSRKRVLPTKLGELLRRRKNC